MLERMTIFLTAQERQALQIYAANEMRDMREQVRYFIHEGLKRRGLMTSEEQSDSKKLPAPSDKETNDE